MTSLAAVVRGVGVIVAASVVMTAASIPFQPHPPQWRDDREIAYERACAMAPRPLWVDARAAADFQRGHEPHAISMNMHAWEQGMDLLLGAWNGTDPIVIYCASAQCRAAHQAANRLERDIGIRPWIIRGGWAAMHPPTTSGGK